MIIEGFETLAVLGACVLRLAAFEPVEFEVVAAVLIDDRRRPPVFMYEAVDERRRATMVAGDEVDETDALGVGSA